MSLQPDYNKMAEMVKINMHNKTDAFVCLIMG